MFVGHLTICGFKTIIVSGCCYWLNWDWPSGLSWEALWLFFPSPTIPIILAPKLERRFLSSSSSSFLPNEQISPPTLDDFVRGAADAALQEERGTTTPVNHPRWQWGRGGLRSQQHHTEAVDGITTVAMTHGLECLIGRSLTLKVQAPPPVLPPLIRSSAVWLCLLQPPLLPVFPLTPSPTPLIGPPELPHDCLSQWEERTAACRQEHATRDKMMKSNTC